jgi:hypothetical protein
MLVVYTRVVAMGMRRNGQVLNVWKECASFSNWMLSLTKAKILMMTLRFFLKQMEKWNCHLQKLEY